MKIIAYLIIAFALTLTVFNIVVIIDEETGNRLYEKYSIDADCSYKLPHQYYLVKDSVTNRYAIVFMHLDVYKYFLSVKRRTIGEDFYREYENANDAITFSDSCKAKGFFKLFWADKQDYEADRFK